MKVAVIGANGQLGCDVCEAFREQGDDVTELNHNVIDVSDFNSVLSKLSVAKPDIVINTAAMHKVEDCENSHNLAFAVNTIGAKNLAMISNDLDFVLVHISTDYVFDGAKKEPYVETDCPGPLNIYWLTKLGGEYFIQNIASKYFILRVSGLYGKNPCRAKGGLNFVDLMLKLAGETDEVRVVADEILTPTFTVDVAKQIYELTKNNYYGLYHATAQGSCSWYQFAANIFEISCTNVKLSVADPSEFETKVPRSKYCVLENRALENLGLDVMQHWEKSLKKYLCTGI